MIQTIPFQTRARTIDHLGREQIADCPTAISELWKNAFDAYARTVELNLYSDPAPVAAMVDDGHGMSRAEFEERWLVVGTEAKAAEDRTPATDRNGLPPRPRQGQKGIGRLSCANLGPTLLLVSKRRDHPFVAALIDWRLFENPFLNLADIQVPVVEFDERERLFEELPRLVAGLAENLPVAEHDDRDERIRHAWKKADVTMDESDGRKRPSAAILEDIAATPFQARHIERWPLWNRAADHGTALLVAGLNYDLRLYVDPRLRGAAATAARGRFFETLSSFVDPFAGSDADFQRQDFKYAVRKWEGERSDLLVGTEKQFDRHEIDGLEHRIEGNVDEEGVFRGHIRAFGEGLPGPSTIPPPNDVTIPRRRDSRVGSFSIYIAAMEFTSDNSTHPKAEFEHYRELARKYSGFMVFRDGLRVMPYGRADNDFFEIEKRRSMSAGREFWNHRQMFGRIAIGRESNPNLKDKAGREGLLDNHAAKTFKIIVSNILMQAARRYFGSDSEYRKDLLPGIVEDNRKERAAEARRKLRQRSRRAFRANLTRFSKELPEFVSEVEKYFANLRIASESDIPTARQELDRFAARLSDFTLPPRPPDLGRLQDKYADYRQRHQALRTTVASLRQEIDRQVERIDLMHPDKLLAQQLERQARQFRSRLTAWSTTIQDLQRSEFERVRQLVKGRIGAFEDEAGQLVHRCRAGKLTYADASAAMTVVKDRVERDSREIFVPYIGALESLRDSIDLEHLAMFGMEEVGELRSEVERLHSLAQLGIAVEIAGHELQAFDDILGEGLKGLPEDVRAGRAAKDIEFAYEGLTDQLRYLSPLRLAGPKERRWITGREIGEYVGGFFRSMLAETGVSFVVTGRFERLRVFDQPSRIYPVFINLLNNSIYWLGSSDSDDRRVVFDAVGSEAVVSDNGPGVDAEDLGRLFTLFFTRKSQGGRGVGLYLCRANLAAGGHGIRYEPDGTAMPLPGANFAIAFRGVEFDE